MAIFLVARLVRETDLEVEYVYGSSPEELQTAPRSLVAMKAGRADPGAWDLHVWPPDDVPSAARVLQAVTRAYRREGDPRWPRGAAYQA